MAKFLVKTKENHDPKGKPRVYFACHKDDFARYFDKICGDLFKTHDCAVYYKEDPNEWLTDEDKDIDLRQFNLIVVPVTFALLSTKNAVIYDELPYAKQNDIPILPIMLEPGLDELYSSPDKFGEAQYLDPYANDITAVGYDIKLKNYLESVLISAETIKRIRAAFDAYVFLSYRKKDRKHAQDLMRLIHANPICRDVAIWYDEFLTPGESFNDNIKKMLEDSKMFALLVTPNLLEEPDGKPNFVMAKEYPYARDTGMRILPIEMQNTDKNELAKKYDLLPPCVSADNEEEFRERLIQTLSKVALTVNDSDPVHNYLIGLAYIEGIDVEVNKELGMELITKSAEADLAEAMEYLRDKYQGDAKSDDDVHKAYYYAKRLADHYERTLGQDDIKTLRAKNKYAFLYGCLETQSGALKIYRRTHELSLRKYGAKNPDTISFLHDIAIWHGVMKNEKKALATHCDVYVKRFQALGETHPDTLKSMSNYAWKLSLANNYDKAVELIEKAYNLSYDAYGEGHELTIELLSIYASIYYDSLIRYSFKLDESSSGVETLAKKHKAVILYERTYEWQRKTLGEEHPTTIRALNNLASSYSNIQKDHQKALELYQLAYAQKCKVLGERHPSTLTTLENMGVTYSLLRQWKKALDVLNDLYNYYLETYGKFHQNTINVLGAIADTYGNSGDEAKKQEIINNFQAESIRYATLKAAGADVVLDESDELFEARVKQEVDDYNNNTETIKNRIDAIAFALVASKYYDDALKLALRAYNLGVKLFGDDAYYTRDLMSLIAFIYKKKGDLVNALKYSEQLYDIECAMFGKDSEGMIKSAKSIEELKQSIQKIN
ncbi:MAG: tetratricopeptide repeat protein [Clostridia bacterium]|nr:tetratricopeptide repeat protein [Clostridia bacterium]